MTKMIPMMMGFRIRWTNRNNQTEIIKEEEGAPSLLFKRKKEYKMTDKLIKALAYHDEVRVYVVDGTETVAEGQRDHDTWSTATAA